MDVRLSKTVYLQEEYEDTEEEILLNSPHPGVHIGVSHDWTVKNPNFRPAALQLKVPHLYIPPVRVSLPPSGSSPQTIDRTGAYGIYEPGQHESGTYNPHLYYGNTETSPIFIDPERVDAKSVFYGNRVEDALANIRQKAFLYKGKENQLLRVIGVGYSCVRSICREVIYGDVPHPFIELERDDGNSKQERIVHYDMGIVTTDNVLGEPLYAGALSSGTQGTLLWVWGLALHMAHHYDLQEGWENRPAVLLIDEIENHLHPTWQRRVIPALLGHFPKLQIFATTHSPFVVAGLKTGQVHLLNRDASGVVTASTNEQDVIGWTADEILRTMMGVADPTDEGTAEAAAELRELRKQLPLADEQEEEERQQRIQELRQRVNRDLLAGGPMAAQRELFEQNIAEILEEHRRSRHLTQE